MSTNDAMKEYFRQQQEWADSQRQMQDRTRMLALAKQQGLQDAKARQVLDASMHKNAAQSLRSGIKVLAVVGFIILMFLYNTLFKHHPRMFGVLTTVMICMVIYKFIQMVKDDGGLAASYMVNA